MQTGSAGEGSPQKTLGSRDVYTNTNVHPKFGMKIPALRSAPQTLPSLGMGMPILTCALAKGDARGGSEPPGTTRSLSLSGTLSHSVFCSFLCNPSCSTFGFHGVTYTV